MNMLLKIKNSHEVKIFFYEKYLEEKKKNNEINKKILADRSKEKEYLEIINYCDFEKMAIIIADYEFSQEEVGIKTSFILKEYIRGHEYKSIRFSETIKFKITSRFMKHPIEVFKINEKEFFSTVAKFHLSCVRSYYNGTTCYLLPSAITAYHTLTNTDFKYFVGSTDPITIINKYRQRGYTTILNKTERNQFLSHIASTNSLKDMYLSDSTEIVLKDIVGDLNINNIFFKPRKNTPWNFTYDPSITSLYNVIEENEKNKPKSKKNKTPNTEETKKAIVDINHYYKTAYPNFPIEFLQHTAIKKNGNIQPLKKWLIDASFDILNS